ncbi:MAG TPA: ATP-binding protein [Agromyces sp.]|nr:ATP-binding protein [Agromyces sp.]
METRRLFAVATAATGVASIAITVAIRMSATGIPERNAATWLIVEPLVLAVLVATVVRWSPPRAAAVSASLAALASALWVQRFLHDVPATESTAASAGWLVLPVAMGAVAWYLRWSEVTRTRAIAMVKAEQRLRLAVDLHDYVAHDISEIVARTQAGRAVLQLDDPRVAQLLAEIEAAGIRALESMDQSVRALGEDAELVHVTRGGIDDIEELVRRFAAAGEVGAVVDRRLTDRVDDAVGAEAYRTVVEALTNVRRHAVRATEVTVRLSRMDDRMVVSIADNGNSGRRRSGRSDAAPANAGGLGLVAMAERVQQLGGSVEAGPQRPRGWRVTAMLPLSRGTHGGATA